MSNRYLTKSRFKLALDCPTKLFYTRKKEYYDAMQGDSFLEALAEGGYQVGELAKLYHPGGHDIKSLDYETALNETNELLKQKNVIIYEPAIMFENFFIRVDVLVKKGNDIQLIEVKAKSINPDGYSFINKKFKIDPGWAEYLYDIAFQKYVTEQAFPKWNISSYLMLADKSSVCPTEGLNQKFRIVTKNGMKDIEVSDSLTEEDLSEKILCKMRVDDVLDIIYSDKFEINEMGFTEYADYCADVYGKGERVITPVSVTCASCQFKTDKAAEEQGFKSGFKECWSADLGWDEKDFETRLYLISGISEERKSYSIVV